MHFAVQKDILVRALRDVTSALATRVVQPILSNVLIESTDNTTIKLQATDLDLTIEAAIPGVVYTPGSVTLPGKKLSEITAKLPNELVSFQIDKETSETAISCGRSKFSLSGTNAEEFPKQTRLPAGSNGDGIVMPAEVLKKSISQTAFAAAGYDASTILGGVYLVIDDGIFACTATDGSRLASRSEVLTVGARSGSGSAKQGERQLEAEGKATQIATLEKPASLKAIIPARACTEIVKLLDYTKAGKSAAPTAPTPSSDVRIVSGNGLIVFETDAHFLSVRLISGEYPRYQELFPSEYKYLAAVNREELTAAVDRVAVMSDDRTHLIKLHFEAETLQISANTPDVGKAQEEIAIRFEGQVLDIAVNVRYMLDVLQRLPQSDVHIEMTGSLKPMIVKGVGDDNYKYLLMPVQAR